MKDLNKIEVKIYWIFVISLVIDNINGILLLNNIDLPISVGQMYRYFMILYFLYNIVKYKNKNIMLKICLGLIYLFVLTFLYFINHQSINGLIMDITYVIKLIFPFIIIAFFYVLYSENKLTINVIEHIFKTFMIIAPLSLIMPRLFNIGYDSYNLGGGYKGFYYSNNEINVLLICTFIYSMEKLYKNKNVKSIIISLINATSLFLIGSKTSLIVIAIVILIYIFRVRKDTKLFISIITITVVTILIFSTIFNTQISEMSIRFKYFYNTLAIERDGGILTFLMSERNLRIIPAFNKNIINVQWLDAVFNFLFGIGRYQQVNEKILNTLMELDLFDTFYWYGFIAAAIVMKKYIQFFIMSVHKKNIYEYKLMYIIIFAFSMIAGHVWYSALAGSTLALVGARLLMDQSINQKEKKDE